MNAFLHEVSPATWNQALNQIGAAIPTVPFMAAQTAVAAINPDAVNDFISALIGGNPLAIVGTILGIGVNAYVAFNKTQLQGITNAQIEQSTHALTDADLNAAIASVRTNTSNPASATQPSNVQPTSTNGPI